MRWPAEALWEAISPSLPGFTVEVVPEVGSTNTELMQRARSGRTDPVLLVAERQTAGRGRLGRAWHSLPADPALAAPTASSGGTPAATSAAVSVGSSRDRLADLPALTCSLGLPLAPQDWSGLSLAVGLALAEALDPAGERIGLKWPNDLWVQGRKLAGILVETAALAELGTASRPGRPAPRYTVVGIGINLAPRHEANLSTPAAALREWWPQADAGQVLACIAPSVVQALLAFEQGGFAHLQSAYAARDLLQGRPLRLSDGTEGRGAGVDAVGALRVATVAGERRVASAEVSVRLGGEG